MVSCPLNSPLISITYGSMRPLRASDRKPEHTVGHCEIACRSSHPISALGSHGSRCARSANRIRLHCAASRSRTGRSPTTPPGTRIGPTGFGHPGWAGSRTPHVHVDPDRRSAALGQEGYVDDLAGADLFGLAGNHHQTVRLGQRRQQMRRRAGAPPSACTRYSPVS